MAEANKNQLAKRETIDIVTARVKEFQNKGEIMFPPNYSPENALKSAWLILQETQTMDKRPVLDVCTKESIANSLLSMVVQGLNPDKKQCYFIPYGNKLQLSRSYFGSMAVAKSVDENIEDIYSEIVYEGDEFEFQNVRGKKVITKHIQKLENIDKGKIIAAYAVILYCTGKEEATVMTIDEIKQSWKQSKMNPVDEKGHIKESSTHGKFTAEMCKKTVINKACKLIINTSDDSNIVAKFAKATEADIVEAEVEQEISDNANSQHIDFGDNEVKDVEIIEDGPEEKTNSDQIEVKEDGPGF